MALENILGAITDAQSINALSAATNKNTGDVSSVLAAALPTLLGSMQVNAEDESQADSLAKALSDHGKKDTSEVLNNLDTVDGEKILGHLLGDNTDSLCKGVAKSTGLSKKSVLLILCAAAPLLMNIMGSNSGSNANSGSGGLGSLLGNLLGASSGSSNSNELQEITNTANNKPAIDLGSMATLASAMLGTGHSNTNNSANLAASLLGLGGSNNNSNNNSGLGGALAGALLGNALGGNSNSSNNNNSGLNLNTLSSLAGSLLGANGNKTASASGKKSGTKTGTTKKASSSSKSSGTKKGTKVGTKVGKNTK